MFDESLIVQSAVSAFNNAALAAPAFFWWAVLAIPVFMLVYLCGGAFLQRVGWNAQNITWRASLTMVVLTLAWIVFFGGNYAVLRDNVTVLPFMIAAIVFVSSVFIGSYWHKVKLPTWRGGWRGQRIGIFAGWALVLMAIGLSDIHVWWGPLLQIGAFLCGLGIGRLVHREMRPVAGGTLVMLATIVAVLMQPEFFRFGQLGALSPMHMLFLILMGAMGMITLAVRNVNARGRIKAGAYIKLKWLVRFLTVLSVAMFVMTESVPVFLGMMVMFFVLAAMSVWHAETKPTGIEHCAYAMSLGVFGVIMTMPAITALGILYWIAFNQDKNQIRKIGRLL